MHLLLLLFFVSVFRGVKREENPKTDFVILACVADRRLSFVCDAGYLIPDRVDI